MSTETTTALSIANELGMELLSESLTDYVASLTTIPAICGTPEQQESLVKLIAEGNQLIKLVEAERLKITRVIDAEKQAWIDKQKALVAPLETAMAVYKSVVHNYNVERTRLISEAKARQQEAEAKLIAQNGQVDWLDAKPKDDPKPKGVRMVWTYELENKSILPSEYFMIDHEMIKEAIRDGKRDIPGLRIFQQPVTTYKA